MIGLLLIFFIGKYFYELAQDYYKHRWLYALLGIIVYYAAGAILGVIVGLADLLFGLNVNWENTLGWNLLGIPIGIAADYGFYILLKRKWEKEVNIPKDEIMDIGKSTNDVDPDA